MNAPQKLKLIDGIFSPEQTQRVLGAMVKSKIDFHNLERHRESERPGDGQLHSAERLEFLRDLDREIKRLTESAKAAGKRLQVTGDIEITFID